MKRLEANTAEKNPGQKVQANSTLCVCALTFEFFTQKRWKVGQMVIQCDAMMTDEGGEGQAGAAAAVNFENCGEKFVLWLAGGVWGGATYRLLPMLWLAPLQCSALHLRQCFRKGHCIALHWVVEPCLGKNALQTHRVHSVHTAGAENTIFWRVFTVHCSATVHCINCSALVLQYIRQWQYTVP